MCNLVLRKLRKRPYLISTKRKCAHCLKSNEHTPDANCSLQARPVSVIPVIQPSVPPGLRHQPERREEAATRGGQPGGNAQTLGPPERPASPGPTPTTAERQDVKSHPSVHMRPPGAEEERFYLRCPTCSARSGACRSRNWLCSFQRRWGRNSGGKKRGVC